MGLKPPPRELVVTTGQVTGFEGRWRGLAGRHAPVATETDDAVDVAEEHACRVPVVDTAVAVAEQIAPPWRWWWAWSP